VATLREVADRAGVSLATASRVASGNDGVRPETRERVERAMRELLYVAPGRPASSQAIGLLLPELANPIFPLLAQAMEARATEAGLASILCNTAGSAEREADYVHMLLERRVVGMIFISCELAHLGADHSHYRRLVGEGARLVFVNGAIDGVAAPSVGVDEAAAGQLATQHLLDLGHRRVGFVAGPAHYLPTRWKTEGWRTALDAAGAGPDRALAHGAFSTDGGRQAALELLRGEVRPTGVICSSDVMAIGVLHAAAELGLRVPEDLSVVGFDGIEATTWTDPQLTTVEQPVAEIAATAVEALQRLIDEPGRELPHFLFRPRLRVRASTAPAPA
jgi:DNA-binding LacI/PurR family transcriptional regulator